MPEKPLASALVMGLWLCLCIQPAGYAADRMGPAAAFRNPAGAIELTWFGGATVKNLRGLFAGDPAVTQDALGAGFVAARDMSDAIWVHAFDFRAKDWGEWVYAGGVMQGTPSLASAGDGTAYIAARDRSNSYWIATYSPGIGVSRWTPLAGVFSTDPILAISADGSVNIIGTDQAGGLWCGQYIRDRGFQAWTSGVGNVKGKASITIGADGTAYVAVRDKSDSLGLARIENGKWTAWFPFWDGLEVTADPQVAELAGKIYVTAPDRTGKLWYGIFQEGVSGAWRAWASTRGVLRSHLASVVEDDLYIYGADAQNEFWWFQESTGSWVKHGQSEFRAISYK